VFGYVMENELENKLFVRSHIESERIEPGSYQCMLTLTSKTRFGAMHGCQEQTCEGDLGGSLDLGGLGGPKRTISCYWGGVLHINVLFFLSLLK
jgi:hypothetical protein